MPDLSSIHIVTMQQEIKVESESKGQDSDKSKKVSKKSRKSRVLQKRTKTGCMSMSPFSIFSPCNNAYFFLSGHQTSLALLFRSHWTMPLRVRLHGAPDGSPRGDIVHDTHYHESFSSQRKLTFHSLSTSSCQVR